MHTIFSSAFFKKTFLGHFESSHLCRFIAALYIPTAHDLISAAVLPGTFRYLYFSLELGR